MRYSFSEYVAERNEAEYELFKVQVLIEQNDTYGGAFGLSDNQIDAGLDALKLGLDAWGLEQFTGWIGDLISGGISAAQGAWKYYKGDKTGAAQHGMDTAISLVSAIPMGDIAKLLKLRYGAKYAKLFAKAGRAARTGAKAGKAARQTARAANVAGQFGSHVSNRAQQAGQQVGQEVESLRWGQPGAVAGMAKY